MLLLSRTRFPVATGLQGIFGKDFTSVVNFFGLDLDLGNVLFILSVCWSFKTGVLSFLKIHSEQKHGMLSSAAKGVLGLRALLFSVTRIICVVAFVGPFLGLMDCQAHWKDEEVELNGDHRKNLVSSTSYWDRETVDLIYRKQDITNYTLVTLQQAFFIFIGLFLLHGVAIFTLKMNVSNHFKDASWLTKIGHVVEAFHVPDVYKDFDIDLNREEEEMRTQEEHRTAYNSALKETLWMTLLQMFSNHLLLVPLLITASKVREKHLALVHNIGTYDEEDEAYKLLESLGQSLPLIVMITTVFEALLAVAYLKWFHPWKIILEMEVETWEAEREDETGFEELVVEVEENSLTRELVGLAAAEMPEV